MKKERILMRLFIAIQISPEMKDELLYVENMIRSSSRKSSVTNENNLHLTLAFIGESDEKERIINTLSRIKFAPFEIKLSHLGAFSQRGEMLIYGALEKTPGLIDLQKKITTELKKEGISFDNKKFLPHITLARRTVLNEYTDLSDIKIMPLTSNVTSFELMSSDLSGRRPVYTVLYSNKASI